MRIRTFSFLLVSPILLMWPEDLAAQERSPDRGSVTSWLQASLNVSDEAMTRAGDSASRPRLRCAPIFPDHPEWTYGCEGRITASTDLCRALAIVVAVQIADERRWRQDANASLDCGRSTIELDLYAECSVWVRLSHYPQSSFTPLLSGDYVFDSTKGKQTRGDAGCIRIG